MALSIEFVFYDERGRIGSIILDPAFHDLPDQVKSLCKNMKLGESFTVRLIRDNVVSCLPDNI